MVSGPSRERPIDRSCRKSTRLAAIDRSRYSQGSLGYFFSQRPLSFVGGADGYTLRDGRYGANDWETIGTDQVRFGLTFIHGRPSWLLE